jgi:hypothetical protein
MIHLKRVLPLLLALIAIGGLAACGSEDDDASTTTDTVTVDEKATSADGSQKLTIPTIVIRDGEPVGGVQELEYDAGEQVLFRVRSNVADEVHVHGYDVEKEIPAGSTVLLSFPADLEGIFEVELHESEQQIAELRIDP